MGGPDFALRLPTYSPDGDIRASFLIEFIHLVIQADINDDTAFFVSYKGSLRDEVKQWKNVYW